MLKMSERGYSTLYLDTTGDTGWPPPYGRSQLQYFVVGGLALTPEKDIKAFQETERILHTYIPQQEWHSPKFELCYHDLIRGKRIYSTLDHPERLLMANEVFDLLIQLEPVLFATVVNKLGLKQRYGYDAYDPKKLGMRATIHRFAMTQRRKDMIGSVTIDEEEHRKDKDIQTMIKSFKRDGIILRGFHYRPRYRVKIDNIINTVNIANSNMTPGIQLADFICRTTWQHFERNKSRRFNQISKLWDRDDSRVYEPVIFPKEM